jgi:uncharacterized surface protein with fasciclin (FAS1) repeats
MNKCKTSKTTITLAAVALTILASQLPSQAEKDDSKGRQRLAGKTTEYQPKEGFERRALDLVNTLKENEVGRFGTLLDGLSQAYDMDNTLRGTGPFTLFAPNDKAFERLPQETKDSLWANKSKLKQVLSYHVVKGKLTADDLKDGQQIQTLEGHKFTVRRDGGTIYIDKAVLKVSNIPCSNGELHVLEDVIMPPLAK